MVRSIWDPVAAASRLTRGIAPSRAYMAGSRQLSTLECSRSGLWCRIPYRSSSTTSYASQRSIRARLCRKVSPHQAVSGLSHRTCSET